jgi:hypothetical protein
MRHRTEQHARGTAIYKSGAALYRLAHPGTPVPHSSTSALKSILANCCPLRCMVSYHTSC